MTFRRRYLIVVLIGVVLIVAGSFSWPADRLSFGGRLARQFQAATGYAVTSDRAAFTLLPSPRLDMTGVVVRAADTPGDDVIRAERATVHLRPWPLIRGRAEANQVILQSPRIVWSGPQRPGELWMLARERLVTVAAEPSPAAGRPADDAPQPAAPLPARLAIVDGTVVVRGGTRTLLRRLNADIAWPSARRQLDFTATALWRGEPVDLRIEKLSPALLAAGQSSPVALRFSAQPVSFTFAGQIDPAVPPVLEGATSLRTGSLARAAAWLRVPLSFSRQAGQVAIKGTARLSGDGLSMPEARIEVAGGTLEGALAARRTDAGRVRISATLDAPTLDFNQMIAPVRTPVVGPGWQRALALDRGDEFANDVDIRLSVTTAHLGPLEMQDVAAGLMISNDRLEFGLNQATIEGGAVRGRLQVVPERNDLTARLNGVFEGIDAQKVLQRLFGSALFSGRASGNVVLSARGQSAYALADSLNGDAFARIEDGILLGVDLDRVIDRARHSPLATALDWRGGRTSFKSIETSLAVVQGDGRVTGTLRADRLVGSIVGDVGIADRSLDLKMQIRRTVPEPEGGSDADVGFPIEISGSWDYPIVTPDIRLLIERSSAVGSPAGPGRSEREEPPTPRVQ